MLENSAVNDETVQRARAGDRASIEALLRELQDPWFRMCVSLLRDEHVARDATQETALRFLRLIKDFRGQSSITTWSIGIAINVCREFRRRMKPAGTLEHVDIAESDAASPFRTAASSETRTLLLKYLNELPDRQREAVVLRFMEELSVEETAAAMSCAPGTVKATVHQALRSLKKRMGDLS